MLVECLKDRDNPGFGFRERKSGDIAILREVFYTYKGKAFNDNSMYHEAETKPITAIEAFRKQKLAISYDTIEEGKEVVKWLVDNVIYTNANRTYLVDMYLSGSIGSGNISGKFGHANDSNWYTETYNMLTITYQEWKKELEEEGMKSFTKADLKNGMRVKAVNGEIYLVLKDIKTKNYGNQDFILTNSTGFLVSEKYTDTLESVKCQEIFTITEVFPVAETLSLDVSKSVPVWKREEKSPVQIEIERIEAEKRKLDDELAELRKQL